MTRARRLLHCPAVGRRRYNPPTRNCPVRPPSRSARMSMRRRRASTHAADARLSSLRYAREIIAARGPGAGAAGAAARRRVLPRGRTAVRVPRQRDRQRHGQGRADRPKDRRHAGLDRHAQPFPASRPRRCTATWAASIATTWCWSSRKAARPKRSCGCCRRWPSSACRSIAVTARRASTLGRAATVDDRAGPAARSLLAGPGPQHQHHGHAGRGRRAGAGDQPDARFSPRGFCPLSSGRQPGAAAEQGRRLHAPAGRVPRGRPNRRACAQVFVERSRAGRRTGAIMLVDAQRASWPGIFTDSDLARLFERRPRRGARPADSRSDDRAALHRAARLDDGRRGRDHGRAEDQRTAGGRRRGPARGA